MNSFSQLIPAGGLIVSCQASGDNPLRETRLMALMARAAVLGGAVGIRANGAADIRAIRAEIASPIIGINKIGDPARVFITPTVESALEVIEAGADAIAIDGTLRLRPGGLSLAEQIRRIKDLSEVPIMADVDSFDAGIAAREAGADAVATTLSGYTSGMVPEHPDIELIERLSAVLDCPIVAEGHLRTRADAVAARLAGAHAVVIGTAITNPMASTRYFVDGLARVGSASFG